MSLIEVLVIGSIGLIVIAGIVSLVTAAWKQDTWTSGRLDAIGAIYSTMDALRVDLFHSIAGQSDPTKQQLLLAIKRGDAKVEATTYAWEGEGKPLLRNGKPLGFAKPDAIGLQVLDGTASMYLDVPSSQLPGKPAHRTRLSVPIVIPDAYWQDRLSYWAPRVR